MTMKRRSTFRLLALLAAAGAVWLLPVLFGPADQAREASAYSNCKMPDFMTGGPHRTLNELALKHFLENLPAGDPRKEFADPQNCELRGPMVVGRSDVVQVIEEPRRATWKEWVEHGGFSADEPEVYNSFRHFYDPVALNPNPRDFGETGVPYLTDHLEQIHSYLSWFVNLDLLGRWYADVRVDARDWAINGEKGWGYWENEYCWNKGLRYLREGFEGQADGKPLSGVERDERFAKAWRALGETMHLLGDMCCPPHVRNDSHPGLDLSLRLFERLAIVGPSGGPDHHNAGILKNDPYELWCQEELIRECGGEDVPARVAKVIQGSRSPLDLFQFIASFTNRNFFSSDTVPYEVLGNPNLVTGNGGKPYEHPELRALIPEKGYSISEIWDRPVKLCHRSWLTKAGWGAAADAHRITYPCVEDQAHILVPLAKTALAQLADWFVPKLDLVFAGYDAQAKTLTLKVRHRPEGPVKEELLYSDAAPTCRLYLDTYIQRPELFQTSAVQGVVTIDLSRLMVKDDTKARFELDVAGLQLRSAEIDLNAPPRKTIVWRRREVRTRTWRDMRTPQEQEESGFTDSIGEGSFSCSWREKPPGKWSGSVSATWTEPPEIIRPGEELVIDLSASATHSHSKEYACSVNLMTPDWEDHPPAAGGSQFDFSPRFGSANAKDTSGGGDGGKAGLRLVPRDFPVTGGHVTFQITIYQYYEGYSLTDAANLMYGRVWEYESVEE